MKITIWRLMAAATLAMSVCLASQLNEAAAQVSRVPGANQAYYNGYGTGYSSGYQTGSTGYGTRYNSGYQTGSTGYGTRYNSGYQSGSALYGTGHYGANGYIYSGRGYAGNPYSGYSNVPYGYGSSATYGYSSPSGYGYSNGTYNSLYYRALRMRGTTYQPLYNPNAATFYNYYGVPGY